MHLMAGPLAGSPGVCHWKGKGKKRVCTPKRKSTPLWMRRVHRLARELRYHCESRAANMASLRANASYRRFMLCVDNVNAVFAQKTQVAAVEKLVAAREHAKLGEKSVRNKKSLDAPWRFSRYQRVSIK